MFSKKKKLTLREIHEVYLLLEHALPEKEEAFLIDELDTLLDKAKPGTILRVLKVIYPDQLKEKSDLSLFVLFVKGLRENNFFEYVNFIKKVKHG